MANLRCRGYSMYRPVQRNKFTDEQHDLLTEFFDENQYPKLAAREKIARQTRLDSDQVRIWFQNKRARVRSVSQKDERTTRRSSLFNRRTEALSEREATSSECPSVRDNSCSATMVYDVLKECNVILNGAPTVTLIDDIYELIDSEDTNEGDNREDESLIEDVRKVLIQDNAIPTSRTFRDLIFS